MVSAKIDAAPQRLGTQRGAQKTGRYRVNKGGDGTVVYLVQNQKACSETHKGHIY